MATDTEGSASFLNRHPTYGNPDFSFLPASDRLDRLVQNQGMRKGVQADRGYFSR
ncbi:hypothetical protein [Enterobacter phage vB_EcRAM-01]|nr:hypothetical protein [Enterobacter phage vB_EcRAM-01]